MPMDGSKDMAAGGQDAMRKHLLKHNVAGLIAGGMNVADAVDMAWDLNEPLFSQRLKMRRKGGISSTGAGGRGGVTAPGGSYGGATGG